MAFTRLFLKILKAFLKILQAISTQILFIKKKAHILVIIGVSLANYVNFAYIA